VSVGQTFPIAGVAIGVASLAAVLVVVIAKLTRGRAAARSQAMLAPYRSSLIAMVSGEDDDGQAQAALRALPEPIWVRLRPSVVAFLAKVRGIPADHLSQLMRAHGEVEEAHTMLTSRSAVRRAFAAYLLGLVRDPAAVTPLLPLLSDHDADVRREAAWALGAIGDPVAAGPVLDGLRRHHGQIGVPAWVVAEALLAMGVEIGPVLQLGLASEDAAVRNVCATVAGQGTYLSAAPQLRVLLATDGDGDVRASSAVTLGRVGGVGDTAILVRHTQACEPSALRRICATALGDLGQPESLGALAALLGDDDRRLAELAADSLVRLGPKGIAQLESPAAGPEGLSARAAVGALELAGLRGQLSVGADAA